MSQNSPDDLDAQITAWIKEGKTEDEIMALVQQVTMPRQPKQLNPYRELLRVSRKRSLQIRRLESRLEAEDCPISLHTLYRGLLRDHEASMLKLIALRQEPRPAPRKTSVRTPENVPPPNKPPAPPAAYLSNNATLLSVFLGFTLAIVLFVATSCQVNHFPSKRSVPMPFNKVPYAIQLKSELLTQRLDHFLLQSEGIDSLHSTSSCIQRICLHSPPTPAMAAAPVVGRFPSM